QHLPTLFPYTTLFRSVPGVVLHDHLDQHVAGIDLAIDLAPLAPLDFLLFLGGNQHLQNLLSALRAHRLKWFVIHTYSGYENKVRSEEHTSELQSRGHL